jgi:hypothetical protein
MRGGVALFIDFVNGLDSQAKWESFEWVRLRLDDYLVGYGVGCVPGLHHIEAEWAQGICQVFRAQVTGQSPPQRFAAELVTGGSTSDAVLLC